MIKPENSSIRVWGSNQIEYYQEMRKGQVLGYNTYIDLSS